MSTVQPPNLEGRLDLSLRERALLGLFAAVASATYSVARGERAESPNRRGVFGLFNLTQKFVSNAFPPCPWAPPGAAVVPDWDPQTHNAILRCQHPGHCWKGNGDYYPCA